MAEDATSNTAAAGESPDNTSTPEQEGAGQQAQNDGFTAITSQEELDQIVQKRLDRERKKFDGFNDYKAKAERLDEVDAERQRLADQVASYEAAEAQAQLSSEVAEEYGVPAEALRGGTREEMSAHAEVLKSHLRPVAPHVPSQANMPTKVEESDELKAARRLFRAS